MSTANLKELSGVLQLSHWMGFTFAGCRFWLRNGQEPGC